MVSSSNAAQDSFIDIEKRRLEQLTFENPYRQLPEDFYDNVTPVPLQGAHLVHANSNAAELVGLCPQHIEEEVFTHYLNGQKTLPNLSPFAMCYAGHQFGMRVPRLGDGRALLLGQVRTEKGELWDMQLKGSGPTLYSRGGDGRAVLRSSIREYLCSEAMHALGIPTTRALCLVNSEEPVYRERVETGALIVRVAQSLVRFGSFEYFYYTGQPESVRKLADLVIKEYYPQYVQAADPYLAMFQEVIQRTAKLIAHWQGVGFAHGVMNSDNMSILGLTLDYGPYGFLDTYEANFICNHSDHEGRYAFDQQPYIGVFNLSCLAQALLPLLSEDKDEAIKIAQAELNNYWKIYRPYELEVIRAKLGFQSEQEGDKTLWSDLLKLMEGAVDYTRFFRALCDFNSNTPRENHTLRDMFLDREAFDAWAEQYAQRLHQEQSEDHARSVRMKAVNPKYILRNYLAEIAIRKAEDEGDYSEIEQLFDLLQKPFDEQPDKEHYASLPPEWAQGIAMSCSS